MVNFIMLQDVVVNFIFENNGIVIIQVNGEVYVMLKGKKVGMYMVIVMLGNNNISDLQLVIFVVDKVLVQVVLQILKDEIIGNGVDSVMLIVMVKDQFDNEVNNFLVIFSLVFLGFILILGVSNINEFGIVQVTFVGVVFGEKMVIVLLVNNGVSDNKIVYFIGDIVVVKIIELMFVLDSIIVGILQNSFGSVIIVIVVDNNGFLVKGVIVNFISNVVIVEMMNGG